MQQAPAWFPYRIRNWIDQKRIERAVDALDQTAPLPAAAPHDADLEVHMLVCKRDLRIGGVAIKSLLRFDELRCAVTFTNDGTLSDADVAWLTGHVPNAHWLDWPAKNVASLDAALQDSPNLAALYGSRYAPVCKLMHATAAARCPRVIVLDPDTAFFQPPRTIIDWACEDDRRPLYLHDHQDEAAQVPDTAREAFAMLEQHFHDHGEWSVQHRFFNSGLLIFRPDVLRLDVAERYLVWWKQLDAKYKGNKNAIWFGNWTPEQSCFHVMFALAAHPAQPLGDDYWLGGEPGHVFNHFLRHYLVRSDTHRMLRCLIDQLPEK